MKIGIKKNRFYFVAKQMIGKIKTNELNDDEANNEIRVRTFSFVINRSQWKIVDSIVRNR